MNFLSIINRTFLIIAVFSFLLAFTCLIIITIHRRRCLNFPTLLVCNTILGIFLFSANNIAISVYMMIWDEYLLTNIDYLCKFRTYLLYSTSALVHHSFVLQAIDRYFKIKGIKLLDKRSRQRFLILVQWIFDFTFPLPLLLTGNREKLTKDTQCYLSIRRFDLAVYMGTMTYMATDITLLILYRRLVVYVRKVSAQVNGDQQLKMHRDLTMVLRIFLLNIPLFLVDVPVLILIILNRIRSDLLPFSLTRVLIMTANLILAILLIILCRSTPNIRKSISECFYPRNRLPMLASE